MISDSNHPYHWITVIALALLLPGAANGDDASVIASISTTAPTEVVATVPRNGDLNPYGVAFVPDGFPAGAGLRPGDILVSNFNNTANTQGTGTTVVRVTPRGGISPFFRGSTGLGLTAALGVLRSGFVLVGNMPSAGGLGTCTPGSSGQEQGVEQGSLLVIDRHGKLIAQLSSASLLDGPWGMAVVDDGRHAHVFVSNALSGSVTRLDVSSGSADRGVVVERMTQIASGYLHRCDSAALIVGPTGLAFDSEHGILYVASTGDNAIFAIPHALERETDAGRGSVAITDSAHLHGPLGLVLSPDGDLLTTQGDAVNPDPANPSEIVEYSPDGDFVGQYPVDPAAGSAFGLALDVTDHRVRFATVDDGLNTLNVWTLSASTITHSMSDGLIGARSAVSRVAVSSMPMTAAPGPAAGTMPGFGYGSGGGSGGKSTGYGGKGALGLPEVGALLLLALARARFRRRAGADI